MLSFLLSKAFAASVTISGISSGGFMASQMAVVHSQKISGVATVAGGVYYCAQNHFQDKLAKNGWESLFDIEVLPTDGLKGFEFRIGEESPIYQSVGVCMGRPQEAHGGSLGPMNLEFMQNFERQGKIDSLKNIAKQRVFIFQGQKDSVVRPAMAEKLTEFYQRLGVSSKALKKVMGEGNHNFPTDRNAGIACNEEKVPYIAQCKYDAAGDLLQHLQGRKLQRGIFKSEHLYVVEQKDPPESVADYGYFYANEFCLKNPSQCDLHVALHGCKMNDDYDEAFQKLYESKMNLSHILTVEDYELKMRRRQMGARIFAEQAGYAEYAESASNHLMVYFPQTKITTANYPGNPKGCWDWYGWTGAEYATNEGKEIRWMIKQIQDLQKNPQAFIRQTK